MKSKKLFTRQGVQGWTEKRLFDRYKFASMLEMNGLDISEFRDDFVELVGLSTDAFGEKITSHLLEMCQKEMFSPSKIGRMLYKFGIDLRIPYLTGKWTKDALVDNLVTNKGLQISAQQVGGTTTAPVTAIALGTGSGQTATSNALATEITSNGGQRGAATVSNQTDDTTGDTERWIKTFNFTGSASVTEEGLFDNNSTGGNMLAYQDFTAIPVDNGDSLQITHNVKYARSA